MDGRQVTSASYKRKEWKIKVIKKVNENRKAVIRWQRWRLRIKLQKDNTDKQSTCTRGKPTLVDPNMTEKRKAVIRWQRWRLRIKLQKDITDKQSTCTRGKPTLVDPNMTEKRKNNKVYYNCPVSQTNHGRVKMLFLKKWNQKLMNT